MVPTLLAAPGFLPHGYCYLWNKPLIWTHLISDVVIGVSYVIIACSLAMLVYRARRDIPFSAVFIAFGTFIIACGMTHFMEVWTLWQPQYWLAGGVKVVTAIASVVTAIAMPVVVPRVQATARDARLVRERERVLERAAALEESNKLLEQQAMELDRQREAAEALAEQVAQMNVDLRASEARYRTASETLTTLFDESPLAILATDSGGKVTMWNPAAERLFGWTAAEVVGGPLPYLPDTHQADVKDSDPVESRSSSDIAANGGGLQLKVERRHKDGTRIPVEISTAPLHDRDEAVVGHMAMLADVTQAKRLEAQLLQAQKMDAIGQLAGGIAHDFNNLLTAIGGFSELVLLDLRNADIRDDYIRQVLRQVDLGAALTRQLLTFSRRQPMVTQAFDLNDSVRNINKMLRRLIGEDIELHTVLDAAPMCIEADISQIDQIIINLAVNARDAISRGGQLTITTAAVTIDDVASIASPALAPGRYVTLTVVDTGKGMDSETQRHIFEPFFTTKEPGSDTGLGLATVYGIVQQSGGTICVHSELGRGTTFTLYFPRADAACATTTLTPALEPPEDGTETVLVVEDEEAIRRLVGETLERAGHHVLFATDGQDALDLLTEQSGQVDLVITDVVMPRMGGAEFVEHLLKRWPGTPVIYTSGYLHGAVPDATGLDPRTNFLAKPFTPTVLLRRVREVLDSRQSQLSRPLTL